MEKKKIFEIGSWVGTTDGYGQVLYNRVFYVEECDINYIPWDTPWEPQKKKIGDFDRVLYLCKIFCNIEGKIKSRFLLKVHALVNELTKEEERMIQRLIAENPEAYEKYITYDERSFPIRQVFLEYRIDPQVDENEVVEKIKIIRKRLPYAFTFKEFAREFKKMDMPFSYNSFRRYGYGFGPEVRRLELRFDSILYATKGKEKIFHNIVVFPPSFFEEMRKKYESDKG